MPVESPVPLYKGTRLIVENDRVVVWEEVFEPGMPIGPHRHERDYMVVALDPGRLTMTDMDGTHEVHEMAAGETVFIPVPPSGIQHTAVHRGPEPHREIVIEFKSAPRLQRCAPRR